MIYQVRVVQYEIYHVKNDYWREGNLKYTFASMLKNEEPKNKSRL